MELQVETFVNGKWDENCYLMADAAGNALVVDPGSRPDEICALVDKNGWRLHGILNTHAHYDHVGAVATLKDRYVAPFYLHKADEPLLKRANLYRMLFESSDAVRIPAVTHDIASLPTEFEVGPFRVSWLATPGHTEGSVCFLLADFLFSGDTLMHDAIGRTDLPGGNREKLVDSVRKLADLPGHTVLCGGHGPRSSIAAEFASGSRVRSLIQ